jgi:hypothetical protein
LHRLNGSVHTDEISEDVGREIERLAASAHFDAQCGRLPQMTCRRFDDRGLDRAGEDDLFHAITDSVSSS